MTSSLLQAVKDAGYGIAEKEEIETENEISEEEKEMKQFRYRLIIAFTLMFAGLAGYHLPVSQTLQIFIEAAEVLSINREL